MTEEDDDALSLGTPEELDEYLAKHAERLAVELSRFRGRVNTEVSNLSLTPMESQRAGTD